MIMYKLHQDGVVRLSDNSVIPNNVSNIDWQEYQKWLDSGNTPETDPPPTEEELKLKEIKIARAIRKTEYIKQLSKYPNGVDTAIGDVLDAIIKHLKGDSTEFDVMVTKIQKIKSDIPIPD